MQTCLSRAKTRFMNNAHRLGDFDHCGVFGGQEQKHFSPLGT